MFQIYEEMNHSARRPFAIGLAPMEGVSDYAFRMWLSAIAPMDFVMTPFLRATAGLEYRHVPTLFCPEVLEPSCAPTFPVIPQFMGSCPDDVCRVAEPFLRRVDFVDLNCGCPSSTVFRHGAGSALLQDPFRFQGFLSRCQERLGKNRFSVKLRLGIQSPDEFFSLLDVLGTVSPALVTVHGRTQKQGYAGEAQWEPVEIAARRLACPVWGSGDVVDSETLAMRKRMAPSSAGVMIGRGAMANPWIFHDLKHGSGDVSAASVYWAFAVFAILQEAQFRGAPVMLALVRAIRPWELCLGSSAEAWEGAFFQICEHLFAASVTPCALVCDARVLSRLKQVTKLFRVGSPSFASTGLLQVKSVAEFFDLLGRAILEKRLPLE